MRKIWYGAKIIFNIIRLGLSPEATDAAINIGDTAYALRLTKELAARLSSDPDSLRVIEERKLLKPFKLLELQKLPAGTLGRVYADHMISNHLDPEYYEEIPITDVESFAIMRLRQTHDLWHVVTNFPTTVPGEITLQAFYYAQVRAAIAPILIGLGLISATFRNRNYLLPLFEGIIRGWQMGNQAQMLFPVDWEAHWETPIDALRRDLLRQPSSNMNQTNTRAV